MVESKESNVVLMAGHSVSAHLPREDKMAEPYFYIIWEHLVQQAEAEVDNKAFTQEALSRVMLTINQQKI